jgi:hypothetical protein
LLLHDTHKTIFFVYPAFFDNSVYHVLLVDFNIDHPSHGAPRARSYCASQLLVSLHKLYNPALILPPETITNPKRDDNSTINNQYSSSHLSITITTCCLREDLDHGSDHFPIETANSFSPYISLFFPKPQWRKKDKAALALKARELQLIPRTTKIEMILTEN